MFAALITNSDAVKNAIRREVRRVADVIIDEDTIEKILREEVERNPRRPRSRFRGKAHHLEFRAEHREGAGIKE